VRLLLDTNVIVWMLYAPETITAGTRNAIRQRSNPAAYSAASIWELAIKRATGKLPYEADRIAAELGRLGLNEIPVTSRHGIAAANLPRHHKDPFDRVIIAQALEEGLLLVSRDGTFAQYGVPLLQA
jgi:PIN domain nuclease of toxin-antitoxin system